MAEIIESLNERITTNGEARERKLTELREFLVNELTERLDAADLLGADAKHLVLRTWSANYIVSPSGAPVVSLTFAAVVSGRNLKMQKITIPLPGAVTVSHVWLRWFHWRPINVTIAPRLRAFLSLFNFSLGILAPNRWAKCLARAKKRISLPCLRKRHVGVKFGGADAALGTLTICELTEGINIAV